MSKPGRNELCSCGSGKKFKRCHGLTSDSNRSGRFLMIAVGSACWPPWRPASPPSRRIAPRSVRVWDPAHGHYHNASGQQVP